MSNQPRSSRSLSPHRIQSAQPPTKYVIKVHLGETGKRESRLLSLFDNFKAARIFALAWMKQATANQLPEEIFGDVGAASKWVSEHYWLKISEEQIYSTNMQRQFRDRSKQLACSHTYSHRMRLDGTAYCHVCSKRRVCDTCASAACLVDEEWWCENCELETPQ